MHFDQIVSFFSADEVAGKLDERNLVKSRIHHRSGSKHAYILFPPWGQQMVFFTPLRLRILPKGHSCLEYEFARAILTSDFTMMGHYSRIMLDKIKKDLDFLQQKGISSFTVVGTSIGSMMAIVLANRDQRIKRVILNTPGNCQAEIIWSSPRLRYIKSKLIKKGLNVSSLKKLWCEWLPENNLRGLKDKQVFINLSKADMVVPYTSGQKLVQKMQALGIDPVVEENKNLGHYLTAARYYLAPNFL